MFGTVGESALGQAIYYRRIHQSLASCGVKAEAFSTIEIQGDSALGDNSSQGSSQAAQEGKSWVAVCRNSGFGLAGRRFSVRLPTYCRYGESLVTRLAAL